MDFQIVEFDETTLVDFQNVILPNVLMDLLAVEDFEEEGLIALGAMAGEEALGAVIARPLNDIEVQVVSLCVAPEYRRQGIATVLLDALTQAAFQLFDSIEETEVPVGIGIDYVMDAEMLEGFEAFLEKDGFNYREEKLPVYVMKASAEKILSKEAPAGEYPEDEELAAWFEEQDINTEPSLCVYAGESAEDVKCTLVAIDAGDESYDLVSYAPGDVSEAEFEAALKLLLGKFDPETRVYADGLRNACPAVLEKAAREGGELLTHRFAEHRMIIEKGEEA